MYKYKSYTDKSYKSYISFNKKVWAVFQTTLFSIVLKDFLSTPKCTCYSKSFLFVNRKPKLEYPLRTLQWTMKYFVNT